MRGKKLVRIAVGFMVFGILFVTFFGWAVHRLWNFLMPAIFGLPQIGFWQALGLLSLSWLLFGGWRGMPHRHRFGGHGLRGRWEKLTPEEREVFARRMRSCGMEVPPAESPGSSAL
jgi:hypothetical protein